MLKKLFKPFPMVIVCAISAIVGMWALNHPPMTPAKQLVLDVSMIITLSSATIGVIGIVRQT